MQNEQTTKETITLTFRAARLTEGALRTAMRAYLNKRAHPKGKMSIKQLVNKDGGTTEAIEVNKDNIKSFEKVARKYGIDFAVRADKTQDPPKYIVFFKAKDAEVVSRAFKEYADVTLNKNKNKKESIHDIINRMKEKMPKNQKKDKHKFQEQDR